MDIIKIVGFAFSALFMILLFKDRRNDISLLISLVGGVLIFLLVITKLSDLINFIKDISIRANIDIVYINIVMKIMK